MRVCVGIFSTNIRSYYLSYVQTNTWKTEWIKVQIHSLTVGGAYKKAEITTICKAAKLYVSDTCLSQRRKEVKYYLLIFKQLLRLSIVFIKQKITKLKFDQKCKSD